MARQQRATIRRMFTESVNRFMNRERRHRDCKDYTRAEIQEFQAELAATGVDMGGGRYPARRSVAFRGPGAHIAGRQWVNGMFVDEPAPPAAPIAYTERSNYYHDFYYHDFYCHDLYYHDHDHRQAEAAAQRQAAHAMSTTRQAQREQQQRARRQHQAQPRPRALSPEELQAELDAIQRERAAIQLAREKREALEMAIAIVNWEALYAESEPARPASEAAAAAGNNDDDNGESSLCRPANWDLGTSDEEEDEARSPRLTEADIPDDSIPAWAMGPPSDADSDSDPEQEYVNCNGDPIPRRDRRAERIAAAKRRVISELEYERTLPSFDMVPKYLRCTNPDP